MTSNKNETTRPEQTYSENPRHQESGIPEAATPLQSLRNSPIMDDEYYLSTSNLCQAIMTIVDSICELVDDVIVSVKEKPEVKVHYLEWTKERLWQIRSIAEVVDDRVSHEDFEKMTEAVKEFVKRPD
jgi:hypothetical protein